MLDNPNLNILGGASCTKKDGIEQTRVIATMIPLKSLKEDLSVDAITGAILKTRPDPKG